MQRIAATVAIVMCGASLPAQAQHFNTVHVARCDNVRGAGDAGIRNCYWTLANQADAERKRLVDQIQATPTGSGLQQAERQWLGYRDAFCNAEHDLFDGGTAGLSVVPSCRLSLTQHHLAELRDGFGWLINKFGPQAPAKP